MKHKNIILAVILFINCLPTLNDFIEENHGIIENLSIEGVIPSESSISDFYRTLGNPSQITDSLNRQYFYYYKKGFRIVINKSNDIVVQVDAFDSTWNHINNNSNYISYPYESINGLKLGSINYTTTNLHKYLESLQGYGLSEVNINGNKVGIYNTFTKLNMNYYFNTNDIAFDVLNKPIVRVSIYSDYCEN
jgi:hypothetical protein